LCEWTDYVELYNWKTQAERAANGDVDPQPLYRSSPWPRGWLTGEEREAVEFLASLDGPPCVDAARKAARIGKELLARSSPPEVVLPPQPREIDGNNLHDRQVWNAALKEVRKALAAAGVVVKEVTQ
jgi:hypothetical protein